MIDPNRLMQLLTSRGIAQEADLIGVSDREIAQLEHHFGLTFPTPYKQFLRHFGRSAGMLSPWMAIYFDDLKEIREQFDILLADGIAPLSLPCKALMIANWESVFDYLICDDSGDTSVYRIDLLQDGTPAPHRYAQHYGEYLENLIQTADTSALPNDFFEHEKQLRNAPLFADEQLLEDGQLFDDNTPYDDAPDAGRPDHH